MMKVQELRPFGALEVVLRRLMTEAKLGNLVEVRITAGCYDGRVEQFVLSSEKLSKPDIAA